jgi:hypothetical protein
MRIFVKYWRLLVVLLLVQCASQSNVEYNIPNEIKPEDRAELIPKLEKGRALYAIHCGSCHSKRLRGKNVIPNFTINMMSGYKKGLINSNPIHAENLNPKKVNPDDLNKIMLFFLFKKRSTDPMPAKPEDHK